MSEYVCIYVAPNSTHVFVCLPALGSSWTFSFWSRDRRGGLRRNNAALLGADWDLWLELPLIAVTNAEVGKKKKPDSAHESMLSRRQTHDD